MSEPATEPATELATDPNAWRVPQEFAEATSHHVRGVVQGYVERDLLGPWDGPSESWSPALSPGTPRDPRDRYLVGMLGPRKVNQVGEDSTDLDLGATVSPDSELPEVVNPRTLGKLWVASMGLSFQVPSGPDAPRSVVVEIDAGRYASDRVEQGSDGKPVRFVTREPLHWTKEIDLMQPNQRIGLPLPGPSTPDGHQGNGSGSDEVALRCQVRERHGVRVVRLTLVNDQEPDATPKYRPWLFQAWMSVVAPDGATPIFVPAGENTSPHADPEEAHLALLYRHEPSFAAGHNVSAAVDRRPGDANGWRIRSEWLPVADVPQVAAETIPGVETSMSALAELAEAADPRPLISVLEPMVVSYEDWVKDRAAEGSLLDPAWASVAQEAIGKANAICARLRGALTVLAEQEPARRAFAFANRAMALQRHNTVVAGLRERDTRLSYADSLRLVTEGTDEGGTDNAVRHASWRAFQLAFVLLNLPSLTDPDNAERVEDVDLLFFPTGGGKTEAYLGLAAYTFAIRRLQGVVGTGLDSRDGRGGVAVLMRYTLRLLTAQQFQRAAALVCAAEVLRREDVNTWGPERFSIGLWVGMSVSPNWYHDAATSIGQARESGRRNQKIPVLQTNLCPWCAEPLRGERDLHPDDATRRVVLTCSRPACPFSRRNSPAGLPIMTVDEEVYREPPSLLIATVDKLAQLPWYGFAGMLFGRVSQRCPRHGYRHPDLDARIGCAGRHAATSSLPAVSSEPVSRLRPPDLIIQDELHLISGALGSTVGLFEGAVDELTSWVTPSGHRSRPKIIASTATTKRAAEQVRALFARDLAIFPPQVLDARDTFFSTEQPLSEAAPGRRYLGVCAHGVRIKAAEIRLAEILLLAGQTTLDTYGGAADPYASVVGYFNSTRELAGMRRYLDDQVLTRVSRRPWRAGMSARAGRDLKITELTSRISSAYITDALRQLTVPFDEESQTSVRKIAIRSAMRAAAGRRPVDLHDERPTDVALATSMLQVGVDITRLGLMVITGQPKNVAEYIQASSRVGRDIAKPGLVITLFNWTRPRDLAYFEGFQHVHASMYRRVEALSVTPYARRCLDRGTTGTVVAAIRNAVEDNSLDTAAELVDLDSPAVAAFLERMLARAERAGGGQAREYLEATLVSFLGRWRVLQESPVNPVGYTKVRRALQQYVALIRPAGEGQWDQQTVARSMRETENDINLLLPPSPQIFETDAEQPSWRTWSAS